MADRPGERRASAMLMAVMNKGEGKERRVATLREKRCSEEEDTYV
jgi:hypothetical protein